MHISTLNNEKELLEKVAQGDEAAFTQLFYAYHNKLGAYIYRITGSLETTKEIVQDVFMKVWLKRETLTTIEQFGPYLYILSRNHTLNCLRRFAKEQVHRQQIIENLNTALETGIEVEYDTDYYAFLDQAVEELPPQQRKVYILSRRERLKYEEIAQRMNISRETVKKYLKLATRFIKNYIHTYASERMSDKAT